MLIFRAVRQGSSFPWLYNNETRNDTPRTHSAHGRHKRVARRLLGNRDQSRVFNSQLAHETDRRVTRPCTVIARLWPKPCLLLPCLCLGLFGRYRDSELQIAAKAKARARSAPFQCIKCHQVQSNTMITECIASSTCSASLFFSAQDEHETTKLRSPIRPALKLSFVQILGVQMRGSNSLFVSTSCLYLRILIRG